MEITPQLIEQITQEVLKVLGQADGGCTDCNAPKLLVVGPADPLPASLKGKYRLCGVSDYAKDGDIAPYDAVVITALTNAQLCDIALGRDSQPAACAVIKALLQEKKVYRLPHILPSREVAPTKGNSELYQTLEGYRTKLKAYGVRTRSPEQLEEALTQKSSCAAPKAPQELPTASGKRSLISAREAQDLVQGAKDGTVTLPKGSLVTPLARDVFRSAKETVLEQ